MKIPDIRTAQPHSSSVIRCFIGMIIYVIPVLGPSVKCWVTLTFDSSPIKETFEKPTSFPHNNLVIPA